MSNLQFGKLPQYVVLWAFGYYVAGMNLFNDDTSAPYFIQEVHVGADRAYYETLDEVIDAIQLIIPCNRQVLMRNLSFERHDELIQILNEAKKNKPARLLDFLGTNFTLRELYDAIDGKPVKLIDFVGMEFTLHNLYGSIELMGGIVTHGFTYRILPDHMSVRARRGVPPNQSLFRIYATADKKYAIIGHEVNGTFTVDGVSVVEEE